jgi:hypothetical protein
MLAQPLAVVGGVAALWATGQTLNIYSMIGLTLLIGLVAKNSILLVDLANQRREQGHGEWTQRCSNACPITHAPRADDLGHGDHGAGSRPHWAWAPAPKPSSRWPSPSSAA